MDTRLLNGDMARDARGLPHLIDGPQELLQRAIIRLTVRRGSFAPDPELGSLLHTLRSSPTQDLDAAAGNLVRQALLPLHGVEATGVRCLRAGDALSLQIDLKIGQQSSTVGVTVN